MPDINKPMRIPQLNLQPPISGKVRLSEDMQQTLALLTTYTDNKRILLPTSQSGVLNVGEPTIKDVVTINSAAVSGIGQGSDIACSMVMIVAHPDNTDTTWVRPYTVCTPTTSWPLEAGDVLKFAVDNVNQVHILCETPEEKVIVAYTR